MNTIRGFTVKLALAAALVVLLAGLGASTALADTITGTDFVVTLTQNGSNVDVVVTANANESLKTGDGADVFFNSNVVLTSTNITNLASDTPAYTGLDFSFATNKNVDGLGTFDYVIGAIGCPNPPGACNMLSNTASVGSYDFTITGVTVADLTKLNSDGNSWGTHICADPGTSCSDFTFFAGEKAPVPEPATLTLLGTGLVMLGGKLRRRLRKK